MTPEQEESHRKLLEDEDAKRKQAVADAAGKPQKKAGGTLARSQATKRGVFVQVQIRKEVLDALGEIIRIETEPLHERIEKLTEGRKKFLEAVMAVRDGGTALRMFILNKAPGITVAGIKEDELKQKVLEHALKEWA